MDEEKQYVDPVDALGKPKSRGQKQSGKRFDSPADRLSASQVAEVTQNKSRAGRYMRKTLTLPPEQIHYISELADQEQIGLLEFYRWLIDVGLQAYEEGARPEVESKTVRGEAKKKHRTSQV